MTLSLFSIKTVSQIVDFFDQSDIDLDKSELGVQNRMPISLFQFTFQTDTNAKEMNF